MLIYLNPPCPVCARCGVVLLSGDPRVQEQQVMNGTHVITRFIQVKHPPVPECPSSGEVAEYEAPAPLNIGKKLEISQ